MPCSGWHWVRGDSGTGGRGKCLKGARKHFNNTWHFMLVTLNSINSASSSSSSDVSNCNFCHATRSTMSAKKYATFFFILFLLQFNKTAN